MQWKPWKVSIAQVLPDHCYVLRKKFSKMIRDMSHHKSHFRHSFSLKTKLLVVHLTEKVLLSIW